ncbi:hypothetical protein GC175_06240 [bacterium]|nr:hypothetical protein [bacterium]
MLRFRAYAILLVTLILTACTSSTMTDLLPDVSEMATAVAAGEMATPDPTVVTLPEAGGEMIFDLLVADGRFTTLTTLLMETGLDTLLRDDGAFTFFAPTDDAFARLEAVTTSMQQFTANSSVLERNLLYHLLDDSQSIETLAEFKHNETLLGEPLTVVFNNGHFKANFAQVTEPNWRAENGVIHAVDGVLIKVAWPSSDAPVDMIDGVEEWIPYEENTLLPVNDGEMVPQLLTTDTARESILSLAPLLESEGVTINLARSVRLEEDGEVKYLIPRASPFFFEALEMQEPVIIGVLLVRGAMQNEVSLGAYVIRFVAFDELNWGNDLADANNDVIIDFNEIIVVDADDDDEDSVPTAGLFYGTAFCRVTAVRCFCVPCGPFIRTAFDERAQCQAACSSR